MLCQNCHQNPATIHLQMNLNGQRVQLDLCQNCYQKLQNMQTNMMNGGNGMNNFGFGSLEDFMNAMNNMQSQQAAGNGAAFSGQNQRQGGNGGRGKGILGQYGINLTDLARQGKIDPVIGRDNEIKRVIEILNRRTKNNPVLIGEAGVGKTAVVEGLATAIVSGEVPEKLANKEIIRLDVVSLVQGTGIRGQFEKRMQQLMAEVRKNKNIILFIDEIHEIMGAGNAEGGMDAGNVLKPALARGDFQLLGATTLNEYRKIEKDAALARRFQPVEVNEPSVDETIRILNGIKGRYQDYHHVKYTDDAIVAAAKLSDRYIQERFLPDKAIDLMDEAGSRKNLTLKNVDPNAIENEIHTAEAHKQQAADNQDYEKAAFYRDQVSKLEKAKKEAEENHSEESATVTVKDMQDIVEEKTNIPVGDLQKQEENQLRDLDKKLDEHVIGQTEAVDKIARAIRRNRIGLNKSGRPIGSFLFVGDDVYKLVHDLSGGEKARLELTKLSFKPINFLILDEPTNHLDIDSREVLENAINEFSGTVLFISHDRYFINQVATDVLDMSATGIKHYEGDYDDYLEAVNKELASTAGQDEQQVKSTAKPKKSSAQQSYQQSKETQRARRKLQRQVDKLEDQMASLEEQSQAIQEQMSQPEVATDIGQLADLQKQLNKLNEQSVELEWTNAAEELEKFDQENS